MEKMFYCCYSINKIYASDDFETSQVTNSSDMFTGSSNIKGEGGTSYNGSYIDKT